MSTLETQRGASTELTQHLVSARTLIACKELYGAGAD